MQEEGEVALVLILLEYLYHLVEELAVVALGEVGVLEE
jgi:predicted urease superfamily metal-dependent hydrolase